MVQGIRAVRSGMLPLGATEVVESPSVAIPKPIATVWREVWGGYRALGTNRSWVRTHLRPAHATDGGQSAGIRTAVVIQNVIAKVDAPNQAKDQRSCEWPIPEMGHPFGQSVDHFGGFTFQTPRRPGQTGSSDEIGRYGAQPGVVEFASGGKSAAVAKTASALASVAALMVKQPVPPSSGGRQLANVSLSVPSGRWAGPIITVKGVLVTALKQENGRKVQLSALGNRSHHRDGARNHRVDHQSVTIPRGKIGGINHGHASGSSARRTMVSTPRGMALSLKSKVDSWTFGMSMPSGQSPNAKKQAGTFSP